MTKPPTTLDYTASYRKDNITSAILTTLLAEEDPLWSVVSLSKVDVENRVHLKNKRIRLIHHKLVLLKPIFKDVKYVGLIIVPAELRWINFINFRAGSSGGHMWEYKCIWFCWPGIHKDIKLWVKNCTHCCAYNVWHRKKSKIYFPWPVKTPLILCKYWFIDTGEING